MRRISTAAVIAAVGLLFSGGGCGPSTTTDPGGGGSSGGTDLIQIDGSSTVFPVTEAVAEDFQASERGSVKVTVGISGTGGGFKKFCRGEIDIADASRPILTEEMAVARENGVEYMELPICFDALTVAVHPENTWAATMTMADLKKIWEPSAQDKVMRWNQVRPEWPDQEIVLFGAGSDSGTFDYFTEAVVGKAKSSRGDFAASEDDNVLVRGIEGNKYALGYIPYAYYEPNRARLKAVAIVAGDGAGAGVLPAPETVSDGTYPLARPLFLYVNKASAARPKVRALVEFYLKNAAALAAEVKYLPLSAATYAMALERFQKGTVGTAFGGVPEVGVHVDEILKREPRT
jgi:phosphate transport system substrate-binding protein